MTYTTLRDITIEDYIVLINISSSFSNDDTRIKKEMIKHFKLDKLPIGETDNIILSITDILSHKPNFIQRFTLDGVEYGFIPNLDIITTAEWVDIENYQGEQTQADKLVSILYRPIKRSLKFWKKDYYSIEEYNGTNDKLRKAPLEVYLGALVFFYHLGKSLLDHIDTYTNRLTQEQKDQLMNIIQSNNLQMSLDGTV
jgi:hypothetical protein